MMDLNARNRNVESMRVNGLVWPVFLKATGVGRVIGFGDSLVGGSFSYTPQKKAGTPCSNDGYRVNAEQAKAMFLVIRGYLEEQYFLRQQWAKLSKETADMYKRENENSGMQIYKQPDEGLIELAENFMDFVEKCQGFTID